MFEFWLQYAMGGYKNLNDSNAVFHTAYVGTSNSFLVKHLRTNTAYTFRICGRGESETPWSAWGVPKVASTSISHYRECYVKLWSYGFVVNDIIFSCVPIYVSVMSVVIMSVMSGWDCLVLLWMRCCCIVIILSCFPIDVNVGPCFIMIPC